MTSATVDSSPRGDVSLAGHDGLSGALRKAHALLGHANAVARQLELAELGDIELPPTASSAQDQARLRTIATLYFAAEVESTRLVASVELVAQLFVTGALPIDEGDAARALVAFHRARDQRLSRDEREAIFGRLFGKPYGPGLANDGGRNVAFEPAMIDLTASLSDAGANRDGYGTRPADAARLQAAGSNLAANLLQGGGGIALFAANEVLGAIRDALAIMRDPVVQGSLGARSVWTAVRAVTTRYLQEDVDVMSHVTRAKAGMAVLAWLAEALPTLETPGGGAEPNDDVVTSAVQWMQATLALHERRQAAERTAA